MMCEKIKICVTWSTASHVHTAHYQPAGTLRNGGHEIVTTIERK
jgi:hypothetical protein